MGFGFQYLGIVVEKRRLNTPVRNPTFKFKEGVIKYTAGILFENAKPYLKDATVVIDASGPGMGQRACSLPSAAREG